MATNEATERLKAVGDTLSQVSGNRVARFPVNPTQAAFRTTEEGVVTDHKGRVVFTPPKVDLSKRLIKRG